MQNKSTRTRQSATILLAGVVYLALTLMLVSASPTGAMMPIHAQPILLKMAQERPDATISVIVQKVVVDATVEEMVTRLGGTVTKDLHIINAFAAEVPGRALPQLARADGVRWVSLDSPVQTSGSSSASFLTWATKIGTAAPNGFTSATNMLGSDGPDKTYGYGSNVKGAFGGFRGEFTPGLTIGRVEVALRLYAPNKLAGTEMPKLTAYVGGKPGTSVAVTVNTFATYTSATNAGTIYVDVTRTRTWRWSDFRNGLEILIDQSLVASNHPVYYDAIGLRITSGIGSDSSTSLQLLSSSTFAAVNTSVLSNSYNGAVRATNVWNDAPGYFQGQGITIAVVDSGYYRTDAVGEDRLVGQVNFNSAAHSSYDGYGHGTFVGSIIGDGGYLSSGKYYGAAPQANILSVRVSDDNGMAYASDVVNGLQWVHDNRDLYKIRMVNISMNSAAYQSYNVDPLDAAVEILWFDKIVVVVSAGNNGTATLYPPANDPFVITVGATNDMGTVSIADDVVASFSAYGIDDLGGVKPDLVAPGSSIIGYLPDSTSLSLNVNHYANRVDSNYFRMSGTSVAAPIVSGAAAILIQSNPNLTPDQIKYRLISSANKNWAGYSAIKAGAGYLDLYAAVHGASTASANTGKPVSRLLWTGTTPLTWNSVNWDSVNWDSVNWNSVNWNSVNWNAVNWNSDYWGP